MTGLRARPPASLADRPVTGVTDLVAGTGGLPPSDVLTYHLDGARVVIRPSGTEPKLKAYLEVTEQAGGRPLAQARAAAAARLAPLRDSVAVLVRSAGATGSPGSDGQAPAQP
jgi:phosphomannomutase